jgi:benzoate-CoA ligase family protein
MGDQMNVSDVVGAHVAAGRGANAAYITATTTLTYDDLRRRINRAAGLLRELGVRREERILLVLDDTPSFPTMFLGAIRMGAVPVPVSVLDTAENYRHFVQDSYARVIVCEAHLLPVLQAELSDFDVRFIAAGAEGAGAIGLDGALAGQADEFEAVPTHRDDVAFWLYSSGSTGRPKGVIHLQHDIEVTCRNFADQVLGLEADDVVFSTTKLFHAYGLGNGLSFPLWAGAAAILVAGRTQPAAILETLRRHRPTVFCSVPALYGMLARDKSADGAFESVRVCTSAAEALPVATFDRFRDRHGLEIVDGIGSTEMLHIYCCNRPGAVVPGTTGRPVPGYQLRLVDADGELVEGAGTGELEVRGDSCAAAYWHQHEKSKRCMRGDWYVTGDRYERREDGVFVYIGRADDMLKVGGLWSSPLDMENALLEHPQVLGAGVVGVTVDDASRIAAFVELTDGEVGSDDLADELRQWCKARLRRYEVPHIVRFETELPRTLTGKVQRFRLRELADRITAPTR